MGSRPIATIEGLSLQVINYKTLDKVPQFILKDGYLVDDNHIDLLYSKIEHLFDPVYKKQCHKVWTSRLSGKEIDLNKQYNEIKDSLLPLFGDNAKQLSKE